MYKVIGIDEAGKGPVLGSMFIGFAIINLDEGLSTLNSFQDYLKNLGACDSKKRKEVYELLKQNLDIKYAQLTPALIDSNNSSGSKLNELEIKAIVNVLENEKPQLIIIDALTANPQKFGEMIQKKLSFETKIISENKADNKYPLVGAASIIAKELREQEVLQIKENIKLDCGSGYPSDKKTIDFVKEHYNSKEFDFIFRKSWDTYKRIAGIKKEKSLLEY